MTKLTYMPRGIENLPLRFLDVIDAPIKTLPIALKKKQDTGHLSLYGFTGTFIEKEVNGKGTF